MSVFWFACAQETEQTIRTFTALSRKLSTYHNQHLQNQESQKVSGSSPLWGGL